ncbi:MAG: hypothetical protein ACYTCU_04150 [Planctomycetota bacterium]|jgi:hypothetical protein
MNTRTGRTAERASGAGSCARTTRWTTRLASAGLLAVLAATALPNASTAYPIDPVPLRLLCERSESIVIARVDAERPAADDGGWGESLADLSVLETLKGPGAPAAMSVPYAAGLICPAPPDYPVGKTLLVFLARGEEGGELRTLSLSYGTKQLSDEHRAVYAQRIREWVAISRELDSDRRLARTVEWLVQMAEDPITRWEAVYDFQDGARPDGAFLRPRDLRVDYWAKTDASQRARLFDLALEPGVADYAWWKLVGLFEDVDDERLTPAILARLRAVRGKPPYVAWRAMRLVTERLGDEPLKAWFEEQSRSDLELVLPAFLAQTGYLGGVPER